jgi:DNA-binding NarL/FixJ family response regulator
MVEGNGRHRFLIVEDDEILGRALVKVVERDAEPVLVTSVRAAKRQLKRGDLDALILDVGLPDGDGLALLAWARDAGLHVPALVITGCWEPQLANRADLLNAQFAFKPEILPNVKAFIRRVTETGSAGAGAERAVVMGVAIGQRAGMTPRELDLVRLVMQRVPRAELATRLGISENTVKTWVRSLLEKAAAPNLEAFARLVLEAVARNAMKPTHESGTVERIAQEPDEAVRRGG